MDLWGNHLSKKDLLSRLGDLRQVAGVFPFVFMDGNEQNTRALRLRNGAGLDFSIILDRGMGIGDLSFNGIPLAFVTGAGYVHPGFVSFDGMSWLRTWPGGFLSTCGLTQVGTPCNDNEELGLHGRVGSIPARNTCWGEEWVEDRLKLWVSGRMLETRMFGEKIELYRRVVVDIDKPIIKISDSVENKGFNKTPFMFLQHINLGYPLLSENTILELPTIITKPRDGVAAKGIDTCLEFSAPIPNYEEQVFYHDLEPDGEGKISIKIINPQANGQKLSVTLSYYKKNYPILVQWKMMRAGNYVLGLEPANCHVEGRCKERDMGTLVELQPGEVSHHNLTLTFDIQS